MRIAILLALAGLAACSREPGNTVDVSAIAAERAKANIENYAAANGARPDRKTPPRTHGRRPAASALFTPHDGHANP